MPKTASGCSKTENSLRAGGSQVVFSSCFMAEQGLKDEIVEVSKKGLECFNNGDMSSAIEHYSTAITLVKAGERNNAEIKKLAAGCFTNRASSYIKTKDYRMAAKDCVQALKRNPNHLGALLRSAQAQHGLGNEKEAKQHLHHAMEIDSSNPGVVEMARLLGVPIKEPGAGKPGLPRAASSPGSANGSPMKDVPKERPASKSIFKRIISGSATSTPSTPSKLPASASSDALANSISGSGLRTALFSKSKNAEGSKDSSATSHADFIMLREQGNEFWQNKDWENAIDRWQKAVSKFPSDPAYVPVQSNLAAAYIKLQKYEEAKKCAWEALEHGESRVPRYWSRYGWCLTGLKDYEGAREAFESALAEDMEHADAVKGLTHLDNQIKDARRNSEPDMRTASVSVVTSSTSTASAAHHSTLPRVAEGLDEKDQEKNQRMADYLKRFGKHQLVPEEEEEERLDPEADHEYVRLKDEGSDAWKQGNVAEAVDLWAHAVKRQPGDFTLHFNLAAGYLSLQQFEQARSSAWAALDKGQSTNGKYWSRYGWALIGLDQLIGARTAFLTSLGLEAGNADATKGLAKVAALMQQKAEVSASQTASETKAEKAASPRASQEEVGGDEKLLNNSSKWRRSSFTENMDEVFVKLRDQGNELWKKKKMKKALQCWEKAVRRQPSEFALHFNMAAGYIALKEYPNAKASAWAALEGGASENPKYWARFGWALMGVKEDHEAGFAFDKAIGIDPSLVDAQNGLNALEKKGVDWAVTPKPVWYRKEAAKPKAGHGMGPSLGDLMSGNVSTSPQVSSRAQLGGGRKGEGEQREEGEGATRRQPGEAGEGETDTPGEGVEQPTPQAAKARAKTVLGQSNAALKPLAVVKGAEPSTRKSSPSMFSKSLGGGAGGGGGLCKHHQVVSVCMLCQKAAKK
eukprot:g6012.t1